MSSASQAARASWCLGKDSVRLGIGGDGGLRAGVLNDLAKACGFPPCGFLVISKSLGKAPVLFHPQNHSPQGLNGIHNRHIPATERMHLAFSWGWHGLWVAAISELPIPLV